MLIVSIEALRHLDRRECSRLQSQFQLSPTAATLPGLGLDR
jgi:hypothetical protein